VATSVWPMRPKPSNTLIVIIDGAAPAGPVTSIRAEVVVALEQ